MEWIFRILSFSEHLRKKLFVESSDYQVEVTVETAAESPRLITITAEVDKPHA